MASRDWNLVELDILTLDYMLFKREIPENQLGKVLVNCLNNKGDFNIRVEYNIPKSAGHLCENVR